MKIEKSREEKESDIISEFVKELDLSDERVKKRLIVESMRQDLFQTPTGGAFLKSLAAGHEVKQDGLQKPKFTGQMLQQNVLHPVWWKKHGRRFLVFGGVLLMTTGVTAAAIYAGIIKRGKGSLWDGEELPQDIRQKKESAELDLNEAGSLDGSDEMEDIGMKTYQDTYLIDDSDTARLSEETLKSFTYEQLNLAMHEIYARHGRRFFDVNIQAYFEKKIWYQPLDKSAAYSDKMLNEIERTNIVLIKEQMNEIENEDAAYDYGSLTIDDMKMSLKKINCSEEWLDGQKDSTIRAAYYDLMEAGYLVNGKLILRQVGSL